MILYNNNMQPIIKRLVVCSLVRCSGLFSCSIYVRVLTGNTTPSLNRATLPAPNHSVLTATRIHAHRTGQLPPPPPAPTWGSKMSIREISRKHIQQLCEHKTVSAAAAVAVIYHRRFSSSHHPFRTDKPQRDRDRRIRPFLAGRYVRELNRSNYCHRYSAASGSPFFVTILQSLYRSRSF